MAKFSKGDKVESVKTGAKGVVDEVYGDEKYAVLFDGATNPDRVEGFQIKAANGCARNNRFKVGDKVRHVDDGQDGPVGVVKGVYGDGKIKVKFPGLVKDGFDGFEEEELVMANSAPVRSANAVVQNAINARRARNAKAEFVQPYVSGDVTDNGVSIRLIKLQDEIKDATADGCAAKAFQQVKLLREVANSLEKVAKWMGSLA